jgi:hypothetical protein
LDEAHIKLTLNRYVGAAWLAWQFAGAQSATTTTIGVVDAKSRFAQRSGYRVLQAERPGERTLREAFRLFMSVILPLGVFPCLVETAGA